MTTVLRSTLLTAALVLCCGVTAPALSAMAHGDLLAPKAFRAAVDKVAKSIVTIETFGGITKEARAPQRGNGRRRRAPPTGGISKPGEGPTTGLIISADGWVLTTTYNFASKPSLITVVTHDGVGHVAKLVGRDDVRKLCLLQIELPEGESLVVPEFISQDKLQVGQWCIAAGLGFGGGELAWTSGVVSATHRIAGRAVQSDAKINPAHYGGPLLDIHGRVIGICVPQSPRGTTVSAGVEWYDSGIGFAIPLPAGREDKWLTEMKAGKHIKPAFMGLAFQPMPAKDGGVVVRSIVDKSPAKRAGVKEKDIIVAVDGKTLAMPIDLVRAVAGRFIGDKVELQVLRDGETMTKTLELAERPPPQRRRRGNRRRAAGGEDKPGEEKEAEGEKAEEGNAQEDGAEKDGAQEGAGDDAAGTDKKEKSAAKEQGGEIPVKVELKIP